MILPSNILFPVCFIEALTTNNNTSTINYGGCFNNQINLHEEQMRKVTVWRIDFYFIKKLV